MANDNNNLGLNLPGSGSSSTTDWLGYGNPYNAMFNIGTGALNASAQQKQDARSRDAYGFISDKANEFGDEWTGVSEGYEKDAESWGFGGKNFERGKQTIYDMFSSTTNKGIKEYAAQGVTSPLMNKYLMSSIDEKVQNTMPAYLESTNKTQMSLKGLRDKTMTTAQDWYSQGAQAEAQAKMTEGKSYWEYFAENL